MASRGNLNLGNLGEESAVTFLKEKGYRILFRKYKSKLGEIDIIAKDKDTFVFIEVKTRRSDRFGLPSEAVAAAKQRQIAKAALSFLKDNKLLEEKARFDVVSISYFAGQKKIDLIKGAFELDGSFTF